MTAKLFWILIASLFFWVFFAGRGKLYSLRYMLNVPDFWSPSWFCSSQTCASVHDLIRVGLFVETCKGSDRRPPTKNIRQSKFHQVARWARGWTCERAQGHKPFRLPSHPFGLPPSCPLTLLLSDLFVLPPSHPFALLPFCPFTLLPSHPFTFLPLHPLALVSFYPLTLSPSCPLTLLSSNPCTLLPFHPFALLP